MITLLLGYFALIQLHPNLTNQEIMEHAWMESLGDDNIMGLRGPLAAVSEEDICSVVRDGTGVEWAGKKSFCTTRLMDPKPGEFEGIQFLGKYFHLGEVPTATGVARVPIPYRPAIETYLRLLYPEYGDLTLLQSQLRALGNYIDAAGNPLMEQWLQRYMDFLMVDEVELPEVWPDNFQRMVSRDYSNVGIEVPAPMRIDYEQWRDLVTLGRVEYRARWGRSVMQHMEGFSEAR
jgi:hypothetical protein